MTFTLCRRMLSRNLFWTMLLVMVVSCRKHSLDEEDNCHDQIMNEALLMCQKGKHPMGDRSLFRYYKEKKRLCWLEDLSDTIPIQTFWSVLSRVGEHGLTPDQFHYDSLLQEYRTLIALPKDSIRHCPDRIAALDYRITESYLLYVRGLRYGFLDPYKLFNTSEKAEPRYPGDEAVRMKELFDIPVERCDTLFLYRSLEQVNEGLVSFLSELYPQDDLYKRLMQSVPSTKMDQQSRITSLEMMRWRPLNVDKGKKHVFVNLASQELITYGEDGIPVLTMKVCCGSLRHKSPMLRSKITRLDANPFWNVPLSIVRREVIPGYRKDTTYFRKHRMKVYDQKGNEISPHEVEWDETSDNISYLVRQDNGLDNSLGKIIFRFPNKFDVYLHDTPNRIAFERNNRAVSHGCIRLEKPLDLLSFLEPDTVRYARIMQTMQPDEDGNFHLKIFSFSTSIPLWIGYSAVKLDELGELRYGNDPYGYNELVGTKIRTINPN